MGNILDQRSTPLLIGLSAGLLAVAAGLAIGTTSAEQAQLAARWTARSALPVFLVTYLASSLYRLTPIPATRAILHRRRQWGLGFALAHSIHLVALGINVILFVPRSWQSLIPGGIAYAMIYIMALTSNDASMRALGKNWKRLHVFGIHYIWFIFTASYAGRIIKPETMLTGLVFTAIMVAALAVRLYARFGKRSVDFRSARSGK